LTYSLVTSADALHDLAKIQAFISRDNPDRALSFVEELRRHARAVAKNPPANRVRRELGHDIRVVRYRGYLLFYRVVGSDVRLLRVEHGARDLSELSFD
jgi:toxin ParE1/3/4